MMLPDITLIDLAGQPKPLGQYRGRKTLVFMWASW